MSIVVRHLLDGTADGVANSEVSEVGGAGLARPQGQIHPGGDKMTLNSSTKALDHIGYRGLHSTASNAISRGAAAFANLDRLVR